MNKSHIDSIVLPLFFNIGHIKFSSVFLNIRRTTAPSMHWRDLPNSLPVSRAGAVWLLTQKTHARLLPWRKGGSLWLHACIHIRQLPLLKKKNQAVAMRESTRASCRAGARRAPCLPSISSVRPVAFVNISARIYTPYKEKRREYSLTVLLKI